MKVNTFISALVEAFADRFTSCAVARECARMFVPASLHGSSSNQKLGTRAARCIAEKFMVSPFPSLLDDHLEVGQSGKRLVGVSVTVTDLFRETANDRMFGHPTRDALDSTAITRLFLYDKTNCHVVTRYGPLAKIVKITCLSHGHVDERSVDSGQGA